MSGRLTDKGMGRRDSVEEALACMASIERDVDEVILRNRQAMRRTQLVVDVLDPALARLVRIREKVRDAQREMGTFWAEEQSRRWKDE